MALFFVSPGFGVLTSILRGYREDPDASVKLKLALMYSKLSLPVP